MRISSVRLKNFRCYFGQQEPLDLSTTPTANLVLVFGENMKGKTSLLQAIRWCLYGHAYDRQGREIPLVDPETKEQLLSRDAESDGDLCVAVEMEFEHDGRAYSLKREAHTNVLRPPETDADFSISKELKADAQVYRESSVDPHIQNMLSEDVSRFFLFDAEMLEEYEDLLKNPEEEALAVKQAIEKILGVPALRVFSSLRDEAIESDRAQNAHLKKRAKHDELLEEVGRLDNSIRAVTSDIAELEKVRATSQQRATDAELAVRKNADIDAKIKQKHVLETQLEGEQSRLQDAREAIASRLQETWWLPVVSLIQKRLENLRADRSRAVDSLRAAHWLERLEASTASKTCALCGTRLDHSALKHVQDELMRTKLSHYGEDLSSLADAVRRADNYEKFNSVDVAAEVRVRHETTVASEIAIGEIETRIRELSDSMGDRAYGDYNAKYERWQRLCDEVMKLGVAIREQEKALRELQDERTKKQNQLNKLPEADPALAFETSVYRFLADVFESAVEVFRDSLRETVGADASGIFKSLTTEAAYKGLMIDENYGLALLDGQGDAVPGRSAGAEQIVALSLIGGLNRAAVREAPVIMDSNFARLDQGHRANVLRFLPQLGAQVVVLVHSGEIDRNRDLGEVETHVARRYEIVRVTETRSKIVPEAV